MQEVILQEVIMQEVSSRGKGAEVQNAAEVVQRWCRGAGRGGKSAKVVQRFCRDANVLRCRAGVLVSGGRGGSSLG